MPVLRRGDPGRGDRLPVLRTRSGPAQGRAGRCDLERPAAVADEPYASEIAIGAGLLTFFAPFIALVVALIMRGSETRPKRLAFLRSWAIASGIWLATGYLLIIILLVSIGARASECRGGIDEFGLPEYTSVDDQHWTATYPCVNGGETQTPLPGVGDDPFLLDPLQS